jgi:proteasome lid subunit RPN8/RPN11
MNNQTDRPILSRIPHHLSKRWDVNNQNSTIPTVEVFITPKSFIQINQHCQSDLDNEVGGWLLGSWCWDDENKKQFIVVDQSLIAPHTEKSATHLTFTQDSQVALLGMQEEFYPGKIVVGWYHTHPRMSIFLSSYDLWLHKHFFSQPWQVAMVVEPYSHTGGIFIRDKDHQLSPSSYCGFNELIKSEKDSRVNWNNVTVQNNPIPNLEESNVTE